MKDIDVSGTLISATWFSLRPDTKVNDHNVACIGSANHPQVKVKRPDTIDKGTYQENLY
jgi:hypothetical protein